MRKIFDTTDECCKEKTGRRCFSFGQSGFFSKPNLNWLGLGSIDFGGILRGEVYDTGDCGRRNVKTITTTCEKDKEFLKELEAMEGKTASYSMIRHSCRAFSQGMFNKAKK